MNAAFTFKQHWDCDNLGKFTPSQHHAKEKKVTKFTHIVLHTCLCGSAIQPM